MRALILFLIIFLFILLFVAGILVYFIITNPDKPKTDNKPNTVLNINVKYITS
jgi:heme/copper-type cytochrome/quinol oxidase subunit 2